MVQDESGKCEWGLSFVLSLFQKASCYARQRGIPFIYISANSGARIGLAEEVKHVFNVAWSERGSPDKVCNTSRTIRIQVQFRPVRMGSYSSEVGRIASRKICEPSKIFHIYWKLYCI